MTVAEPIARQNRMLLFAAVAVFLLGVIAIFWASDLPVACPIDAAATCDPHARLQIAVPGHLALIVVLVVIMLEAHFNRGRSRLTVLVTLVFTEAAAAVCFFVATCTWSGYTASWI